MSRGGVGTQDLGPIYQRWGLIFKNNEAKGIFSVPYKGMQVGVLGCVACHSGKAAGEYVVGLGNKNIDVGQIGKDAYLGMKIWGAMPRANPDFKELHKRSLEFTKGLSDKSMANLTQGLVPTGLIRSWFIKYKEFPFLKTFREDKSKFPISGVTEKKENLVHFGMERATES